MTLTELIKGNTVEFSHYRANHVYYEIQFEGEKYTFPVALEDIGGATIYKTDKAITFMRWIRKAMDNDTFLKEI